MTRKYDYKKAKDHQNTQKENETQRFFDHKPAKQRKRRQGGKKTTEDEEGKRQESAKHQQEVKMSNLVKKNN